MTLIKNVDPNSKSMWGRCGRLRVLFNDRFSILLVAFFDKSRPQTPVIGDWQGRSGLQHVWIDEHTLNKSISALRIFEIIRMVLIVPRIRLKAFGVDLYI